eukprot:TRINITY_DN1724_c5_g3_i1.p1 TRINITY_DN1724_c5_g3~~TRINITY_DN1724_c5_g3_i1.p1  ORF type:complete len:587 (+),score=177.23 TRINITY_DN1724_c5_g3_i1:151-1761(+)
MPPGMHPGGPPGMPPPPFGHFPPPDGGKGGFAVRSEFTAPPPPPTGPPPASPEQIADFCDRNGVDDAGKQQLLSIPPDQAARVMAEGELRGAVNPNAVLSARIRNVAGGLMAARPGLGPPKMQVGPAGAHLDLETKLKLEEFCHRNGIDDRATKDLLRLPPELSRLVINEGDMSGVHNPNSALKARIKRAQEAQAELALVDPTQPRDPLLSEQIAKVIESNPIFQSEFETLVDRTALAGIYDPMDHPARFLKAAVKQCMGGYYKGMAEVPERSTWKKGDWLCNVDTGGCGAHNYASRQACKMCSRERPVEELMKELKKGDWICPKERGGCGTHNFARRDTCSNPRCNRKRPDNIPPPPGQAGIAALTGGSIAGRAMALYGTGRSAQAKEQTKAAVAGQTGTSGGLPDLLGGLPSLTGGGGGDGGGGGGGSTPYNRFADGAAADREEKKEREPRDRDRDRRDDRDRERRDRRDDRDRDRDRRGDRDRDRDRRDDRDRDRDRDRRRDRDDDRGRDRRRDRDDDKKAGGDLPPKEMMAF